MQKRFVAIWFCSLTTDWFIRRQPLLKTIPFVLAAPDHGRMIITAVNTMAKNECVKKGMVVADARAIIPSLEVLDDKPELPATLLKGIAEWCIRYSPFVSIDLPDGIILNATGCAHLWGDEKQYLTDISKRLIHFGYNVRIAMADTIGAAWAIVRFGNHQSIVESGRQPPALLSMPSASLRLEAETLDRLDQLGLRQIKQLINMPRSAIRRRFGRQLLQRLDQALGYEEEIVQPVFPIAPYQERLPCLEPIITATGIEIALQRLLDTLCHRLQKEEKGLRMAVFKCYRTDGRIEKISIGTNRPSCNRRHILKLFEDKIETIEPAGGIELFTLETSKVEDVSAVQEKLWSNNGELHDIILAELLDRLAGKIGLNNIHRYVPDEHYLPERSFKKTSSIDEKIQTEWKIDKPRPLQLLSRPEPVEVTAPIPDYPPMLFRHKEKLHTIIKADGPERIEQEWWLEDGQHRDYYYVEDEEGKRYWLFRSGHYDAAKNYKWFIHGFFA